MTSTLKYLGLLCALFTTIASAQTVRQLDDHDHGNAKLSIVIYENQISLALESPAVNIVGFEHLPKNEEQQEQIDSAKVILGNHTNLFNVSADANCQSTERSVHWTLDAEEHEEHDEHDEHDEHEEHNADHSEFEVEFLLTCRNIENLNLIDVQIFDRFPLLKTIQLEALLESEQRVDTLKPGDSKIEISL